MQVNWKAAKSAGNWRITSGLVLFLFLATHLLNHALGLISLDAMEAGRLVFLAVWRNVAGTTLLTSALIIHVALVLHGLYRRRTLAALKRTEVLQIVAGLAIPPLIVLHVLGTHVANKTFELNDTYAWVLATIWVADPLEGLKQATTLVAAWVHGCFGLHFWLRLKPWYPRYETALYTAALLLPVVALAGFASGGREVALLMKDPAWVAAFREIVNFPGPEAVAWIYQVRDAALWGMATILLLALAGRYARLAWERRRGFITISYPEGRRVSVPPGLSVLEASRLNGIPHASVCGGRGRCSTCRIRVHQGAENLAPPDDNELRVLHRVGAPDGVRLACQARPTGDLAVTPLLPAGAQPADGYGREAYLAGGEREIAILFADLRAFTRFSERKLPYDVVFVLNQYFRAMGQAVERSGGQVDKFIGDGVMALFGLTSGPKEGCREALEGAQAMVAALDRLNHALRHELVEPLRIGIGIHIGPVIVGEMGYSRATSVTAIGDAVNTASRLETMTKEFASQLVVSRQVALRAGVDLSAFPRHQIEVRGRSRPMNIFVVENASDLPLKTPVKTGA